MVFSALANKRKKLCRQMSPVSFTFVFRGRGCLHNSVANHVPALSSILRIPKSVLIGWLTVRHFHISLNTVCLRVSCPPTYASSFAYALSTFVSGRLKIPREDEDNAYAKLFACVGGQETHKQRVLWEMWKWRIGIVKLNMK